MRIIIVIIIIVWFLVYCLNFKTYLTIRTLNSENFLILIQNIHIHLKTLFEDCLKFLRNTKTNILILQSEQSKMKLYTLTV